MNYATTARDAVGGIATVREREIFQRISDLKDSTSAIEETIRSLIDRLASVSASKPRPERLAADKTRNSQTPLGAEIEDVNSRILDARQELLIAIDGLEV